MSSHITDVNVNLFRWPYRRVTCDETNVLVHCLREHGVTQAWTGSFEGPFHRDIGSVNARLAEECRTRGHNVLLPFGSVNPAAPDWQDDLRRCHEEHKMRGIRLHPNYHGYKLNDPVFAELLHLAAERNLIVQLAVLLEDKRTQVELFPVAPVDLSPLGAVIENIPNLKLVLLNAFQSTNRTMLAKLAATNKVWFEIATLEGAGGIEHALPQIPISRLLFGSHAPLFYFESAQLKLKESALNSEQREAICHENAMQLLHH